MSASGFCERLSKRGPTRQIVTEDKAVSVPGDSPSPEDNVVRAEHDFLAKRVQTALDRARQVLAPEERLILKMRFEDRIPVADIARALHLNQRRLYRTLDRILAQIAASMASEGVSRADVQALFADDLLSGPARPRRGGRQRHSGRLQLPGGTREDTWLPK